MISLIFSLLFPLPTYTERVAVEAAYVVMTYSPPKAKCCGLCKNGKVVHGDGHVTDCLCPAGCACKSKKECKTCLPAR
jgi:hypothetical protein